MKLRKTLALILALAVSVTWCLADVEEDTSEFESEEVAEWVYQPEDEDAGEDEAAEIEPETPLAIPFPDVSASSDYAQAVAKLAEKGIITGDPLGNFNPDASITRAETAAIICRLMGVDDEAKYAWNQTYSDVSGHWAEGYITKATELGVFNGDGAGNFRPYDNVTYEQIIKILVCVRGHESEAQRNGGWPNGYIAVAKELGITNGVRIDPKANAPRSAVAQFIYNVI